MDSLLEEECDEGESLLDFKYEFDQGYCHYIQLMIVDYRFRVIKGSRLKLLIQLLCYSLKQTYTKKSLTYHNY